MDRESDDSGVDKSLCSVRGAEAWRGGRSGRRIPYLRIQGRSKPAVVYGLPDSLTAGTAGQRDSGKTLPEHTKYGVLGSESARPSACSLRCARGALKGGRGDRGRLRMGGFWTRGHSLLVNVSLATRKIRTPRQEGRVEMCPRQRPFLNEGCGGTGLFSLTF